MNTKTKGDISVAKVMAALLKSGKSISLPFGDCQRYDMIMDENGKLSRIQIKTARISNGALEFNLSSVISRAGGKIKHKTYQGQIEYFGVYSPDLDKCYLMPATQFDGMTSKAYLRIEIPKNNQKQGVRYAKQYEI